MSFSFNFLDDDIDDVDEEGSSRATARDVDLKGTARAHSSNDRGGEPKIPVENVSVEEVLSSLPDRVSFSTTLVSRDGSNQYILIPRRALFDVRLQIIAEEGMQDDGQAQSSFTSSNANIPGESATPAKAPKPFMGLGDTDIEQDVYEGGFKSWEGALDLARLVLDYDLDAEGLVGSVIELGCGTGLPSLVLLAREFESRTSDSYRAIDDDTSRPSAKRAFTFADYNRDVLRLVTLPNILLVWSLYNAPHAFDPQRPSLGDRSSSAARDSAHPQEMGPMIADGEGDLLVTPELLSAFCSSLSDMHISLSLLAGPWNPGRPSPLQPTAAESPATSNPFLDLLGLSTPAKVLILAAETIYSPESLTSFTTTLLDILRLSNPASTGLVAAKKVYFGVGGGVAEFKQKLGEYSIDGEDRRVVVHELYDMDKALQASVQGIGRWLGEIKFQA